MSLATCWESLLSVDSCDSPDRSLREMAERTLTREKLLVTGAGAVGALALPRVARGGVPKAKQQLVFKLVPNGHTCKACQKHDTNSLFPSAKAANGNRAHVGCNCSIVEGSMDYGTFVALFGNPKRLESYRADLRSARSRAVLKNHEPVFARY